MSRNVIETVMGGVVLLIAGGFLVTAYQGRQLNTLKDGYVVNAKFDDASGIVSGSDVRIGGVKVGVVDTMTLDNKTFRAIVGLKLSHGVDVPADSTAIIKGDGLLGSKFVALDPGGSNEFLKTGEEIQFTQSSISLEEMIGKFMFSGGGVDSKDKASVDAKDKSSAEQNTTKKSDDIELSIP
jgi:phospholipid/cholesterol/gamma-HCH transport system substrate-binding protein